jgi:beta-lactamase superfamily II metal-dependent hydrolase
MRRYVNKTTTYVFAREGERKKQVLWGDWLDVEDTVPASNKYVLKWKRWSESANGFVDEDYLIDKDDTQEDMLLEMIFIDVGQGDGCILAIPSEGGPKIMVIDAGVGDNMHNFLKWRFRHVDVSGKVDAAVITHPDKDHYNGFQAIFDDTRFSFNRVFHNGLLERKGPSEDNIGKRANGYCLEVYETAEAARELLSNDAVRTGLHPKLMWTALSHADRFKDVLMASAEKTGGRAFLPGYNSGKARVEILGPLIERDPSGNARLREFGAKPGAAFNKGKTKNGHSVLLKLMYGNLSVIFGGDLNSSSEDFLLRHYGEIGADKPLADAVPNARKRLAADVLKCCHHGSADVTDEFLDAVNPFAFVVSSGDNETHVHPRPEVLGLLGKKGRGSRPLVLCTEILRSTAESMKLDEVEGKTLNELRRAVDEAVGAAAKKAARRAEDAFWASKLRRTVGVYGAVNVRTDGEKFVVAFLKEGETGSRWHTYEYAFSAGEWALEHETGPGDH